MTSYLPGWRDAGKRPSAPRRGSSSVIPVQLPVQPTVSGRMVDEAVDNVVARAPWDVDTSAVLKGVMGRDASGLVGEAYYNAQAASTRLAERGVSRKKFRIPFVLNDDDVAALSDYAPEYSLRFTASDEHDHAMAAACRALDRDLIMSKLPLGVRVSDLGGEPVSHVKAKHSLVHVCNPDVDVKDEVRMRLRGLELKHIAATSDDAEVAELAARVLEDDPELVCRMPAQRCMHQSPVVIAVHVYDVDLEDWPRIMQNKGASLVEGCMLFSSQFFATSEGELGVSKARYEIDIDADTFRMGFSKSAAWWYEHKWSRYMLYGVDQILVSGDKVYSYKVVERRGDTIYYRIILLEGADVPSARTSAYRTPGVEVVRVSGFELSDLKSWAMPTLRKKEYLFPANLWREMVSQASEDFERGVMDYQKMYNHYRTISVRQTINAKLIMGGERVSQEELVPLVVHACLAAAAQSLLGQRETRVLTLNEMKARAARGDNVFRKVGNALASMATMAIFATLLPFKALAGYLRNSTYSMLEEWMLDWEPVATEIVIEAKLLMANTTQLSKAVPSADDLYVDNARTYAHLDHHTAIMKQPKLRQLAAQLCPHVIMPDDTPQPSPMANKHRGVAVGRPVDSVAGEATLSATSAPTYRTVASGGSAAALRRAAIKEHIDEITLENRALVSTCSRIYRELCVRSQPDVAALRRRAEMHRNPDLWEVRNGTVVRSALGIPVEDFKHSAVYHPKPDPNTDNTIRDVYEQEWEGDVDGVWCKHVNHVLADSAFSGWVMTTDSLVVHNGAQILSSLSRAIELPHEYEITLHSAPPGSGKTYSIVHAFSGGTNEAIMCPVKESITDTRQEVIKLHGQLNDAKLRIRTLDSYLVNLGVGATSKLKVDKLFVDECFMAHSGKIYAAAALLGATRVEVYGDRQQIPHIPRVQASKMHVRVRPDFELQEWTTRRCPASAVAAWGGEYDWKVRSLSKEKSHMTEVMSTKGREVPAGCVMLCMYQADKVTLRTLYAKDLRRIKIMTAHEAEGKTFDHVWLHRFDMRRRSDNFSLFDQSPHVLVAMSRHRKTFVYCRPQDLGDLVTQWIKRSQDPRRVAAAAQVESAGVTKERL